MKLIGAAFLCAFLSVTGAAQASVLPAGLYTEAGNAIYVGIEHELPDPAANDFYDPSTHRTGTLAPTKALSLKTAIREERRIVRAVQGPIGVSLYYRDRKKRSTIILIHGSDAETREMGFIIPFFVLNGINVVSYDQRGTGSSSGNWFLNGPMQRAQDVTEIYDAIQRDPLIDSRRIGVWGFSNGGWTAPIVAVRRPLAFMILKSAPAESLLSNIDYEVTQEMQGHNMSAGKTHEALAAWHSLEAALNGNERWSTVERAYDRAKAEKWFDYSLLPGIPIPPAPVVQAGLRRFISYDPADVLQHVVTPTLALYGSLDRKVDVADSSALMRRYFHKAGMRDFTMKVCPQAGHPLVVSNRYACGYPEIMISWLAARGFTKASGR